MHAYVRAVARSAYSVSYVREGLGFALRVVCECDHKRAGAANTSRVFTRVRRGIRVLCCADIKLCVGFAPRHKCIKLHP